MDLTVRNVIWEDTEDNLVHLGTTLGLPFESSTLLAPLVARLFIVSFRVIRRTRPVFTTPHHRPCVTAHGQGTRRRDKEITRSSRTRPRSLLPQTDRLTDWRHDKQRPSRRNGKQPTTYSYLTPVICGCVKSVTGEKVVGDFFFYLLLAR